VEKLDGSDNRSQEYIPSWTFSTPTGVSAQNPLAGVNECYRDVTTVVPKAPRRLYGAVQIIHIDKYGGAAHHSPAGMWGAAFQPIAHCSFLLFPIGFEKRAPGSKPPI
jgi:hypothetical protein